MKLNPVELSSKEIVSWGVAFPRRAAGTRTPVAETATSPDPKVWRMDATIGSVLGTVAGKPALPSSD